MIFRVYPTKDTFITNVQKNRVQQTGSNFGGAESLDLFKIAGVSGTSGVAASASISRILMQFDLSTIAALTASGYAPTTGISYKLKVRHATTAETLPSSYDVNVLPISRSWDEGRGIDVREFLDRGYANWTKATSTTSWTSLGGDVVQSTTSSYHFDLGYEDLEIDVTSMMNAWLTGGLPNNGLMVKLTGSVESDLDFSDYYIKRFYSRTSSFKDRRPFIEARWDDSYRDDRSSFFYNTSGTLFLYNRSNGQLANLSIGSNQLRVRITDSSGTLMTLTGSFTGRTGIYSASFAIPTGSYSGSVFSDMWGSGSFAFATGTFYPRVDAARTALDPDRYTSKLRNLSNQYDTNDVAKISVMFRTKSFNPTAIATGSIDREIKIAKKAYFAIENESTRERVIQFGTGSIESTRLSYDAAGNYFNFHMSNLHSGNVYRIIFMVEEDGQTQIIDNDHKFKVA